MLILSPGKTTASTLIYDYSGSSYHYNSDFGTAISSITISAEFGGSISGTVLNDTNGLTDSTVNGTGIGAPGNVQLYANLVNSGGTVVSSVSVGANGAYTFSSVADGSYTVQISTNQGVATNPAPAISLPAAWINVGESTPAAGNDATVNGSLAVTIGGAAVANVNFGIEQPPTANNNTAPSQTNPGGSNSVSVPATVFSGTDTAPGTISNIRITAFPSNAASITINGTNYTSANFPSGGVAVLSNAGGNPTQAITVDPNDGAVTVGISYVTIDNARVASASSATASVPFATVSLGGNVFNDANGLTDNAVNGTGTNAGGLFANLLDAGGNVLSSVAVAANGAYSFAGLNAGNYTVQISINQGTAGSAAPLMALPSGWVNTGESPNDTAPDGALTATVAANVANLNFGIQQRPVAANHTAPTQSNLGGTFSVAVPPATFSATDAAPGTVTNIRITNFPNNIRTIEINGVEYTTFTFPVGGVTVPTNLSGNPTQKILIDPFDGAVTVPILYVAIDNSGAESSATATANVPFAVAPTAAPGSISGKLTAHGSPLRDTLVVLIDGDSGAKEVARTDADGVYLFSDKEVGKSYVVQPLSSKYAFSPSSSVVDLVENAAAVNFDSAAKTYRPKNDFDGDGKSDIAVFRPSEGNWYVLRSSDAQMSVFRFGLGTDAPVSADFDGDGKTDYAVFRPSEGNWYVWQSATETLRVENFGLSGDRPVPSDFDGDGKSDIAVYRNGAWFVRRSSDDAFEARNFGLATDAPVAADFDGDGKTDFSVYRPSDGTWYTLYNSVNAFSARRFGLERDAPATGDFDGDGKADIAQFRAGNWYLLNSTTDFAALQLGTGEDQSIVGDFDGDGRADAAVYRGGVWLIKNSGDGTVRKVSFGLPTDVLVK